MKAVVALAFLSLSTLVVCRVELLMPEDSHWSWSWGPWSSCSKTCDWGVKRRYRGPDPISPHFISPHDNQRSSSFSETRACCIRPCSDWTTWSSWSSCVNRCKTRIRTCLKPTGCSGSSSETVDCKPCAIATKERYTGRCGWWWGERSCLKYRIKYKSGYC